jgi:hypothetical protein
MWIELGRLAMFDMGLLAYLGCCWWIFWAVTPEEET